MSPPAESRPHAAVPDYSLVMPCYNEEGVLGYSVPQLLRAFEKAGYWLELVAIDNGSADRTGEILSGLQARFPSLRIHRVDENRGFGNGVLQGLALCTAPWVGYIPADGQISGEDVVRIFELAASAGDRSVVKARRRFRMESLTRRVVSWVYNTLINFLFGSLRTADVNAVPKVFARQLLSRLNLQSKDWFLDAELLIKAKRLGLNVVELNVFDQMRPGGRSNVRPSTCVEFLVNLLSHRFGRKRSVVAVSPAPESVTPAPPGTDRKAEQSVGSASPCA